jgi:two-component system, response regulator YesN
VQSASTVCIGDANCVSRHPWRTAGGVMTQAAGAGFFNGEPMIKAIIVEDERLIREGIAGQVPWKELHVDDVRTAENAEAALTICREFHPDIVVSDIRMPGMDGITLCTKLRELLPGAQIIFISGYSDKEYLMSAIGLHAVNYIEKPVSLDEFNDAVRSAVSAIEKNRNEKTNALHTLLNSPAGGSSALSVLQSNAENNTSFFVVIVQGHNDPDSTGDEVKTCVETVMHKLSECSLQYITDFITERKIAVLFFSKDEQSLGSLYQNSAFWQSLACGSDACDSLFVGIGTKTATVDGVRQSYEAASDALKCLAFKGWGQHAYSGESYTEWNTGIAPDVLAGFKKSLFDKHEQHALGVLSSVYRQLVESNALLTYAVRNLYYTLDDAVEKTYHFEPEELAGGKNVKDHTETIRELHEYLCSKVHEALSAEDVQKNCFAVNRITAYIQKNYSDKMLSVQSIADAVFLTPTYISCLFKKKTGKTIGQYIQNYRMQKAVEFLRDPQYKIYQISDMVGYEDAHYFTKLFKKQTGLKPSDFRDQAE